ncbi:cupin domain-containing protein [Thermodesulforhabdus norvegica]|uniref:Cupin domain protein n=1 Tax=Thermodesulforhabdus norvegica TaxID=39841 RepID=A0A1I4TCY1_9BACT|nr:cupin domain-containing protein [Thermodesulforhabdus norvegica]SFM74430.1 Cupin domain protein [Thermodesulforhabdus norvegica]
MKVVRYRDVPARVMDGGGVKGVRGRVLIGKDDGAGKFCMRIFELEPGGHTPLHAHDWEHEIFVHKGSGSVWQKGQWVPIEEGTAIFIPGGEEHQIRNTGTEVLTFVCLIPSGPPEL